MKYSHEDLVRVAKRQNNNKRGYLVVNPMQGKHVPVSPGNALQLFDDLAKVVENEFGDDKLQPNIFKPQGKSFRMLVISIFRKRTVTLRSRSW